MMLIDVKIWAVMMIFSFGAIIYFTVLIRSDLYLGGAINAAHTQIGVSAAMACVGSLCVFV